MPATVLFAALLASLVGAFAASIPADDPDLFWHLASGQWMLAHGRILDHDVFSFTLNGAPYVNGQWLGQVLMAGLYAAGAWVSIDLLRGALVGIAMFFTARAVLRLQPNPIWATGPFLAALLVSKLIWGDRPQLFSLALFPLFLDTLLAVRMGASARRLWILPPLTVLWANLHGSFLLGIGLIGLFAIDAWLRREGRFPRAWIGAAALSAAAGIITPAGIGAFTFAASYAASTSRVVEEQPADVSSPAGLLFLVLLLLACLGMLLAPHSEGRRYAVLLALLVPPFAYLGLSHQRQLAFASVVLAPFVAFAVPAALHRTPVVPPRLPWRVGGTAAAAFAIAALAVGLMAAPSQPDLRTYPAGALSSLRQHGGNLFHEYDWGGYLIFADPKHPTFIDGRGASLFPASMLREFEDTVNLGPSYAQVLDQRSIDLVLVRPQRALGVALRNDGWTVLDEQQQRWVLLARPR